MQFNADVVVENNHTFYFAIRMKTEIFYFKIVQLYRDGNLLKWGFKSSLLLKCSLYAVFPNKHLTPQVLKGLMSPPLKLFVFFLAWLFKNSVFKSFPKLPVAFHPDSKTEAHLCRN